MSGRRAIDLTCRDQIEPARDLIKREERREAVARIARKLAR